MNERLKQLNKNLCADGLWADGLYIGIMSGTSLDAMDAVLVQFISEQTEQTKAIASSSITSLPTKSAVRLIASHSMGFPKPLRQVLLALCQPNGCVQLANKLKQIPPADMTMFTQTTLTQATLTQTMLPKKSLADYLSDVDIDALSELDWAGWASRTYAEQTSKLVQTLLEKAQRQIQAYDGHDHKHNINNVNDGCVDDDIANAVMAIGCHGQTVRHRPRLGFSTQLMDANVLAERTGINVVSDFRRRDMAVGGQGAPLVPAFHHAMFADDEQWRVLVNLGGIANITVLPPLRLGQVAYGYDTGPANLLLDAWVARHSDVSYDAGGQFAQSGKLIEPLLKQLLAHEYFTKPTPKSTGREEFHLPWLDDELQTFAQHYPDVRYSPADVQNTLTELTAISVANEINRIHKPNTQNSNTQKTSVPSDTTPVAVFACGGGAYNDYLLLRMASHIPQLFGGKIVSTEQLGLPPIWVEATAFAWLARQTLMGQTGNLPSVTGAEKAVVLGQVCFA